MLFEKFLFSLITSYFGKFTKNFNKEVFRTSILRGSVHLHNLELSSEAFSECSSVKLLRGTISSLTIKLPWLFLYSKKCQIQVDKICIVLSTNLKNDDKSLREKLEILNFLTKITNNIQPSDDVEKEKSCKPGFFQRLRKTILDNIQIEVNELSICLVSETGALEEENIGVFLKATGIKCEPTDSDYVLCPSGEACDKIFRRVVIENVTLLVNNQRPTWRCLNSDQDALNELDFEDFAQACGDTSNSQTVLSSKKAIINIGLNSENSAIQCSTVIESGVLFIDRNVFKVFLLLINLLNKTGPASGICRPVSRPTPANASAWWQYAIYLVVSEISMRRKRLYFDWDKYISWKETCSRYYNRILVDLNAPWIVTEDIYSDNSDPEGTLSLDDIAELRKKAQDAVQKFKQHQIVSNFTPSQKAVISESNALIQNSFFPSLLAFELPKLQVRIDDDLFLDIAAFSTVVHMEGKKIRIRTSLQGSQINSLETELFPHTCRIPVASSNEITLACDIYRFSKITNTVVSMPSVRVYISESSFKTLCKKYEKYRFINMLLTQKLEEVRNVDINDEKHSKLPSPEAKITMNVNSALITIEHVNASIEGVCLLFNPDFASCSMSNALLSISELDLFRCENIILTPQVIGRAFDVHVGSATIEDNLVAFEHIKNEMPVLKQHFYDTLQKSSEKASEFHDSKIFGIVIEFTSIHFNKLELCNVSTSTAIRDGWKVSVDCNGIQSASTCYPHAKVSLLMWANSMLSSSPYAGMIVEKGIGFSFHANDLHLQVDNVFAEIIELLYDVLNIIINPPEDVHIHLRDSDMFTIPNMSGSIFVNDCSVNLIDDEDILLPIEISASGKEGLVAKFDYYGDRRVDTQIDWGDSVNAFIKGSSPTVVDLFPHRNGGRCSVRFHFTPPASQDLVLFPYTRLHLVVEAADCDAVMHFPTIQALWMQFNSVRLPLWRLRRIGARVHFSNRTDRGGPPPVRSPTSQRSAELGHAAQLKSAYGCEVPCLSSCHLEGIFPMEITMDMKFTQSGLFYLWDNGEIASMYFHISSCEVHLSNCDGCLRAELAGQFAFPQLRFISPTSFASPASPDASLHVAGSKIHSHYTPFGCSSFRNPLLVRLVYTNDSRPPFNTGVSNESLNVSISGCTFCKPSTETPLSQIQYEPILVCFELEEVAAWLTAFSYRSTAGSEIQSARDALPGLPSFAPPCTKFVSEEANCDAAANGRCLLTTVQFTAALLCCPTSGIAITLGSGVCLSSTSTLNELCIPSISLLYSKLFFYDIDYLLLKAIIWGTPRQYNNEKNTDIHLLAHIESLSTNVKDDLQTRIAHQMNTLAVYWATSKSLAVTQDSKEGTFTEAREGRRNLCSASRHLLVGPIISITNEALLASLTNSAARIISGFSHITQTVLKYNNDISLVESARIDICAYLYSRDHKSPAFMDGEGPVLPLGHRGSIRSTDVDQSSPFTKTLQESVLQRQIFCLFIEDIHIEYNWHTQFLPSSASIASIIFQCGPFQYRSEHQDTNTGGVDNTAQLNGAFSDDNCHSTPSSFLRIALDRFHVHLKLELTEVTANSDADEANGSLKPFIKIFPLVFPFNATVFQPRESSVGSRQCAPEKLFNTSTSFSDGNISNDINDGVCLAAKGTTPLSLALSPLLILLLPTSYILLYELMQRLTGVLSVAPTEFRFHPVGRPNTTQYHSEVIKMDKQSIGFSPSDVDHSLREKHKERFGSAFTINIPYLELRILKFSNEEDEWVFVQSLKVMEGISKATLSPPKAASSTNVDYQEEKGESVGEFKVSEGSHRSNEMMHKEVFNVDDKGGYIMQSPSVTELLAAFSMPRKVSEGENFCFSIAGKKSDLDVKSDEELKRQGLSQWAHVSDAHAVFGCDCFVFFMNNIRFAHNIVHKWSATLTHAVCKHYVYDPSSHPPRKGKPCSMQAHYDVSLVHIDGFVWYGRPTPHEAVHHATEKTHQRQEGVDKEKANCKVENIGIEVDIPSMLALAEFLIESPLKRINFTNCKGSQSKKGFRQNETKDPDSGITATGSPHWVHITPIAGEIWSLIEDVHLSHRRHGKVLYFRSSKSNHLTVHMNGHTIFFGSEYDRTDNIFKWNHCQDPKGAISSVNGRQRGFQLDQALIIVEAGLTVRFVGTGRFRIPIHHWCRDLATKVEQMGIVVALLPYTTLGEASWVECEGGIRLGFTEDSLSANAGGGNMGNACLESNPNIVTQLPRKQRKVAWTQNTQQCQRQRLQTSAPFSSLLSEVSNEANQTNEASRLSSPAGGYKTGLETSCNLMHSPNTSSPMEKESEHAVSTDNVCEVLANPVSMCVAASSSVDRSRSFFQLLFATTLTQIYGVSQKSAEYSLTGIIKELTVCWRSLVEPRFFHLGTSLEFHTHFLNGQWLEGQIQLQHISIHSQLEGVYSRTSSTMILAPTSVDVCLGKGLHHVVSLGSLNVDITKSDVDMLRSLIDETQAAVEYFLHLRFSHEEKEILRLIADTVAWRPVNANHAHKDIVESNSEEATNSCSNAHETSQEEPRLSDDYTPLRSISSAQHEGGTKSEKSNGRKRVQTDGIELTSFALYIPLVTVTLSDYRFPLLRATVRDIVLRHTANAAFERAIFMQSQAFEVDVFGKGLWDSVLLPTAELTVECIQSKSRYSSNTHFSVVCNGLQMQCSYRVLSSLLYATNQASTFLQQQTRIVPPVPNNANHQKLYSPTAIPDETAHDSLDAKSWCPPAAKVRPLHSEASTGRSPAVVQDSRSFPCSSPLNLIDVAPSSTPLSPAPTSVSREALTPEATLYGEAITARHVPSEGIHSEQWSRDVRDTQNGFVYPKVHLSRSAVSIEGAATHRFKNSFNCTFYLRIGRKSGCIEEDWLCVLPSSSVDVLIPYRRVHELFVCVFTEDCVAWSAASGSYILTTKGKSIVESKAEVAVSELRYGKGTGLLVGDNMLVVLSCVDPRRSGASAGRGAGIGPDGPHSEMLLGGVACEALRWAEVPQSALPVPHVGSSTGEAAPIQTSEEEGDVAGLIVVQIHAKLTLCNKSGVPLLVSQHLVDERNEGIDARHRAMQGRRDTQLRGTDGEAVYELLPTGYCYPLKSNCFILSLRCNTNKTFFSVYEAEIDVLALRSGMLLRLYPFSELSSNSCCDNDDGRGEARWGSYEIAPIIRQDTFNDRRPLTFLVMCKEITESQSRVITLFPCMRIMNHTGVSLKISVWQKDGFAGSQTSTDCELMEPWLPRESKKKWCVPTTKQDFFYNSLVPLAIHHDLRHNHALSILQCTVDSNLAFGLSFTQCTGAVVRTEGIIPIVNNLREAAHCNSSWLPLHDSVGRTFYVHAAIFKRVIVLSVAVWVCNLTCYPLLLADSSLTYRLTAGQDANTGIIPSQGTPFLIGCKLQDFPYMSFKIGLDGEWSSLVRMDVGSSGVFESVQKEFRISRSCSYTIQFPNLQMGRPVVLCITPRWVFINRTTKSLRLFFDYPGMRRAIEKTREEARKAASQNAVRNTGKDITMALASIVSIELNPGEYHISCIGTDIGNKLILQEKVETKLSSSRTTPAAVVATDGTDAPMLYESLRTDHVPIDQPGQATLNLWVIPRPLGVQDPAALPLSQDCTAAQGPFDALDNGAVVTGRITVAAKNVEGTLAVVLIDCSDQHVLIQNRTQGTKVMVTQKGSQRRSLIPVRQDRFFFWEDSRGEHVIRVHAQGSGASWFEIDFTHGNCLITQRQNDSPLRGKNQSPRATENKKGVSKKCLPQQPSNGISRAPPFHVRGYVSAKKKRVTVIITDEPIPRYVIFDPWQTSTFLRLRVPFMQARWLRDDIQTEGVGCDIVQHAALVSCAMENLSLDWLDTEDSSNGFATIHQLQLIDEMRQVVFVYRARVKHAPLVHRSGGSSPHSSAKNESPMTSTTLRAQELRCASGTSPLHLSHCASSSLRSSPSALVSPQAVRVPVLSSHAPPNSSYPPTGSWLPEESPTNYVSESTSPLALLGARHSSNLAAIPQPHHSSDTLTRGAAHAGQKSSLNDNRGKFSPANRVGKGASASEWVSGSVLSLMGYKVGDWAGGTMELECDLKLELSIVKYPDGMRCVTELHGSITALVVVISDLWLAHFLREALMLRNLLVKARRQRQCKSRQLPSLHLGEIERFASSRTEEVFVENSDRYFNRLARIRDGRNEEAMMHTTGAPSFVAVTLQPAYRYTLNLRHNDQVGYYEGQQVLTDLQGGSTTRLPPSHPAAAASHEEGSALKHFASQSVALSQERNGNVPPTEFVPQSVFVVRLVHIILAQQESATEISAATDTHLDRKGRQPSLTAYGRGGNFQPLADSGSPSLFYVEKIHFSRVTFFITFTRQDSDPLWPLIGAYTLMLPNNLRQCEFYIKPFTLERYVGTVSSIEAILRKWCIHGLSKQWTKATKLGTVLNMLQWWRTKWSLRGPPVKLNMSLVNRLRSEMEENTKKAAATRITNAFHPSMVPFMPSDDDEVEETDLNETPRLVDLESQR